MGFENLKKSLNMFSEDYLAEGRPEQGEQIREEVFENSDLGERTVNNMDVSSKLV